MGYIKSPDGGFILEDDQFELFYDNLGRKGIRIVGVASPAKAPVTSVNGKKGAVEITCDDINAVSRDIDVVERNELKKYLPLSGGVMDDMASIYTNNMLSIGSEDKAETSYTSNGFVFIKGVEAVLVQGGDNTVKFSKDGTVDFGKQQIINVTDSTDNTGLVTKKYVDDIELRVKSNEDLLQALNDEIKDCKTELASFKTRVSDVEEAFPTKLTLTGGTMEGNIDMNSYSITDVQKLHIDGVAPVYIGSVIEQSGTQGVRLTGTTAGEAAFVKPDTQNTYAPVFGAEPTSANHLATKQYVDSENNKMKETMESFKLPDYSADNNGYVLMIQNGIPTWVKMS